ncbi:hypothetical protein EHW66_08565 [Erwinia psidii]|uniref:hypothetical protein n=1 Tax=Erwinia psidii TaxID=69224 RepID=UPI00226B6F84|nr:hypothetical protein [Erwinia psidii]MCX8965060.1 hypothetical protein [Erwinia psidii]
MNIYKRRSLPVDNAEPTPDAYLPGAQRLEPEACGVLEDVAPGVLSGLSAGCHVIAVNVSSDSP